jgi:hypothetical protein
MLVAHFYITKIIKEFVYAFQFYVELLRGYILHQHSHNSHAVILYCLLEQPFIRLQFVNLDVIKVWGNIDIKL